MRPLGRLGETSLHQVSICCCGRAPKRIYIPRLSIRDRHARLAFLSALRSVSASVRVGRRIILARWQASLACEERGAFLFDVCEQAVRRRIAVDERRRRRREPWAVEVTRPARRGAAVVHTVDLFRSAAAALGTIAVTLGLGEAAGVAGAVGANLFQGDGRGRGRSLDGSSSSSTVVGDALELQTLAVAAAVGAAITFDLW